MLKLNLSDKIDPDSVSQSHTEIGLITHRISTSPSMDARARGNEQ